MAASLSAYVGGAFERLRPQTLRSALEHIDPKAIQRSKDFINRSLLSMLAHKETARTINAILSAQIERLLMAPIGRLGDHLS